MLLLCCAVTAYATYERARHQVVQGPFQVTQAAHDLRVSNTTASAHAVSCRAWSSCCCCHVVWCGVVCCGVVLCCDVMCGVVLCLSCLLCVLCIQILTGDHSTRYQVDPVIVDIASQHGVIHVVDKMIMVPPSVVGYLMIMGEHTRTCSASYCIATCLTSCHSHLISAHLISLHHITSHLL